jgi:hypothetical protein
MLISYRARAWHLALVALIAIFGAVVLYMVLFPDVSADYRAYYIDRSASCFPRADNVATGYYPLGQPVTFATNGRNGYQRDTIRSCGFMPPSSTGIRSFGDYGVLKAKFPIPDDDLLLTVSSWTNTDANKPRRDVKVLVNGEAVGTLVYTTAKRVDGKFVIPQRLAKLSPPGGMLIRFEVPRTGPPGTNSEPVTLQLRLEAMRIVPLHSVEAPVPPGEVVESLPDEGGSASSKEAGSPPPPKLHKREG